MDYYLKANSEAELWQALKTAGAAVSYDVKNEAGEVVETRWAPAPGYSIDVIGTVYKPTGNMIQQTVGEQVMEIPEMAALPGFHANMRGPDTLAPKTEYTQYTPTQEELQDPDFVMPQPTVTTTPSPIEQILVYPTNPVRTWA